MPLPPIVVKIRQQLAATSAAVPGLVVSDDQDFLDGMIHTAALEYDAAAGGGVVGRRGGTKPDWQPVGGHEALACRIVWKRTDSTEGAARPGAIRTGRVLFGQSIAADRRHRLVYADPDAGAPAHAYFLGPVRNAHMMNHHWTGDIQDREL